MYYIFTPKFEVVCKYYKKWLNDVSLFISFILPFFICVEN